MKKIKKIYDKIEEISLAFSLVVTVIVIFMQVVARKVFNTSLSWSEELARYIFIWQCWLGVSLAYKNNSHIRLDMLIDRLKGKKRSIAELFVLLIMLVFNIFLIKIGIEYMQSAMKLHTTGTVIKVPMAFVILSLPFSSFIVSLRILGSMKFELEKILKGADEE